MKQHPADHGQAEDRRRGAGEADRGDRRPGTVADQPPADAEHRREREEQIVSALRDGEATPDALVPLIYRGLNENLFQVARETVLAHLLKLEREGRAARHGDSWHIMEP